MTAESDFKRFLVTTSLVVAAGILATVSLVAVIDPYRLYGLVEVPGINHVKPAPTRYQKQIKMHGALAHQANTFILGNSRAELGFNPEHAVFRSQSAYNLALAGTSLGTGREQLEHLAGAGVRPVHLVVGVEFLDFLIDTQKPPAARAPKPDNTLDKLAWRADALFSLDSLADSLKTLRLQRLEYPQTITARGFNPLLEYNNFAREDGYFPIFQQRALENAKRLVRMPRGLVDPATGTSANLQDLRAIIQRAVREQVSLNLVIYPYHAQLMAMFEEAGLAGPFDAWKALLVREVSAARQANPDARITLWDFSGYSPFQCEAIPAKGDKITRTRWYWEAGHFKAALGDVMLSRIFTSASAPDGFGIALDTANAQANRARIERERAACAAAQPKLFEDARALVSSARAAS